jgi:alkylation response protein AidB-like acyl-CoA dehydrogenase
VDFDLSPEPAALQEPVRRLAQDKIKPRGRDIDTLGEYPQDSFDVFRDADLLGLCLPTEYGGSGAGILGLTIAIEEVAKYSNSAALMLLLTRLPAGPILIAGSDVAGIRTRAVADTRPGYEGDWVLSGTKCRMSGVVQADWYTVFAKTGDPASRAHDSITCFIVERAWDGVCVGSTDHRMGVRGVDTGELLLDQVHVPKENMVGEVGGFRLAMLGLNPMRPIVAARPGQVHQGVRALPGDGQVPRHRAGGAGLGPGRAAARCRRVHGGPPPDRVLESGRPSAHHRGGDLPGAARAHRPGRAQPRPVVGLRRRDRS